MNAYEQALRSSCLTISNAPYIEGLYERYLSDKGQVSAEWALFFDSLDQMMFGKAATSGALTEQHIKVMQLVEAYRVLGVRAARLDPLDRHSKEPIAELDLDSYKLSKADLAMAVHISAGGLPAGAKLSEILAVLADTYCGTIGFEYMHISNAEQRRWIQERVEKRGWKTAFTAERKLAILERLTAAETLERFLHTRYVGQKRFSLEGGESLIPLLDQIAHKAGADGVKEIVLGMAHRGRLNVLVNVLGKLPSDLFAEFEGKVVDVEALASGDVKYHKGFSCDLRTAGGVVHLSLAFNPSHLEIVDPVVEGSVRARQDRRKDESRNQVVPVVIHGDAAFSGQGVVMETMNLAQTRGYRTGGTLHIVVNNQIGFTTSDARDCRSTLYCTDIAKMVESPVFHVNGDDPEAVVYATELAFDFRQRFHKDVVIDLVCYRMRGHNEADEPMVTQPAMYREINKHPGTRTIYADKLVSGNVIPAAQPDALLSQCRARLEKGESTARDVVSTSKQDQRTSWTKFRGAQWRDESETRFDAARLGELSDLLGTVPSGFELHDRVKKIFADRKSMGKGEKPLDWGMAEMLAYATILDQGFSVRISGQDCGRGTFFHRHAVAHDQNRERWQEGVHVPFATLENERTTFTIIDSILSEEAVLGFEYGYATAEPDSLVIWEAQFGDFANGAQVVIDQFISSGEAKWGRFCGLIMLLPHGYEGQGPEHSSARLERYLQLCAEENIQVCVPTTPAQMFHLLRRQIVRPYRKPLVVMTPKSLLRHKDAVSRLDELTGGAFQPVIGDPDSIADQQVSRVILCTGKLYYDLLSARQERHLSNVAIIRLEQLYPFPDRELACELTRYPHIADIVWAQEEPKNQGSWMFVRDLIEETKQPSQKLLYAGRPAAAAPAAGYHALHVAQLKALIDAAFAGT